MFVVWYIYIYIFISYGPIYCFVNSIKFCLKKISKTVEVTYLGNSFSNSSLKNKIWGGRSGGYIIY